MRGLLAGLMLLLTPFSVAMAGVGPLLTNAYFTRALAAGGEEDRDGRAVVRSLPGDRSGIIGYFNIELLVTDESTHVFEVDILTATGEEVGHMAFRAVKGAPGGEVFTFVTAILQRQEAPWLNLLVFDGNGRGERRLLGRYGVASRTLPNHGDQKRSARLGKKGELVAETEALVDAPRNEPARPARPDRDGGGLGEGVRPRVINEGILRPTLPAAMKGKPAAAPEAAPTGSETGRFAVLVGAFGEGEEETRILGVLRSIGVPADRKPLPDQPGMVQILAGPFDRVVHALLASGKIERSLGIKDAKVVPLER
ncbi:MAG: hypothetical protein HQL56_05875 [Magnetococcales bacterium]|nr:hypothetical protein [Magnetococcales bacterium]